MRDDKFQVIFKRLKRLIPDLVELEPGDSRTFEAGDSYMPLNLDVLERHLETKPNPGGVSTIDALWLRISLAHTYIQNGDVMSDPDMEIRVYLMDDWQRAEALTYQLDGLGIYQQVYPEPGRVCPRLKQQLNAFLLEWLNNIRKQGYQPRVAA